MKVSAKQHIVLREPSLLDVIQTASLRWDGISAKYYDSIDQVLRVRPFGLSWLLLHLDSDPEGLEAGLKRLTVNPDWRDLNWILFASSAKTAQAAALKEAYTQIKQVVSVPCSADQVAQVYAELLDPNSPSPKARSTDKRQTQSLLAAVEQKEPVASSVNPPSSPEVPLLPPPRFKSGPLLPATQTPSFSPVKMGAPAMPPPPQGLEKFIRGSVPQKTEPSPPGATASASSPKAPTLSPPPELKLPSLVPHPVQEVRPPTLDDRLEELFEIYPTITDYVIQNSNLDIVRVSSEGAEQYAQECTLAMNICVKIGQEFGFGNVNQIDNLSHSKVGVFFSLNPNPVNLDQFRVVLLLSKKGANLTALANHLRKTI